MKGFLKLCFRHPGPAWHLAALRLGVEVRLGLAAALDAVPGRALAFGLRLCGLAPALFSLCSVQVLPVLLRALLVGLSCLVERDGDRLLGVFHLGAGAAD